MNKDMLLAIETTAAIASVCITRGGRPLDIRFSRSEMNHLTELTPMIRDVLADNRASLSDLDTIAVSAGPGSFTGMRIGVSTARALAQASGRAIISVPTLETYLYQSGRDFSGLICPVLDARLSSVYASVYAGAGYRGASGGSPHVLLPQGAYEYASFANLLDDSLRKASSLDEIEKELHIYGDGYNVMDNDSRDLLEEFACSSHGFCVKIFSDSKYQRNASHVAMWAYEHGTISPYTEVEPIYIRKAEAQRRLDEGLLKPHA